jgi:uncharacterized protein YjbI with pentapeptide repeats
MMMDAKELKQILDEHKKWICSNCDKGKQANLRFADLQGADLRGANLRSILLASVLWRNSGKNITPRYSAIDLSRLQPRS